MNILVTGSSGWLGQTLVPRLVRAGHKVVGLDPEPGPIRDEDGRELGRQLRTVNHVRQKQRYSVIHSVVP